MAGNTSNTFLAAMNQGLNLAHTAENDKRLEQQAAMMNQLHQMQMLKLASDMAKEQKPDEYTLSEGQVRYRNVEGTPQVVAKGGEKKEKEFNIPAGVDEFLLTKFAGYAGDPETRKKAGDWLTTPQGRKEYLDWKRSVAETRPVNIQFVPTAEGIVGLNPRNPNAPAVNTGLGKPVPSEQMSRLSDLETLKSNIDVITKNFDPGFVGPVAGRTGAVKEKFVDIPEKQVQFYAAVRDASDALLRARSGAQINEQEYQRLISFLPDANLPAANFKARLNRFTAEVNKTIENRKTQLMQGGYGQRGSVQQPIPQEGSSKRFKILKVE